MNQTQFRKQTEKLSTLGLIARLEAKGYSVKWVGYGHSESSHAGQLLYQVVNADLHGALRYDSELVGILCGTDSYFK